MAGMTGTQPAPQIGSGFDINKFIAANPGPYPNMGQQNTVHTAAPAPAPAQIVPTAAPAGGGGSIVPGPSAQQIAANQAAQAAAAAKAAQDAKIAQALASGSDSQLQTGLESGSAAGANYQGQAGQLYGQLAQGQNTIDQARKSIAINQISSIHDLMNTIRQGLHGTGVQLASTNALDSSAAGAAARAYANYGNVETNKINSGASVSNEGQDVNQKNLDIQRSVGMSGLKSFRDNAIATITTEAQKGLDGLKQYIALLGGDGGNVDVNGIKQQILSNAQSKLAAVDGYINDHINGVHAIDRNQLAQDAYKSSNAGVIPSGPGLPFQLDQPGTATTTPAPGGAPTSLIPLAVRPKVTTI